MHRAAFLKWFFTFTAPNASGHSKLVREDLVFDGGRIIYSRVKLPGVDQKKVCASSC